jgi:hypothetical protein
VVARILKIMVCLFVCLGFPGMVATGHAAVVSLVGDRDCFGLDGSCPDGPTGPTFPIHEATDPAFMDTSSQAQSPTYHHVYDLGGATPLGATLEIRTSELADNRGPWGVFFNDTQVGSFAVQTGDFIVTYVFAVAFDLLTGNDEVRLAINEPSVIDGYAIDYSELTVETAVSQVPVPAALPLLFSALAALGLLSRWRRSGRG